MYTVYQNVLSNYIIISQVLNITPYAECGSHISLSVSIFLTISIAIERYQAVCFAHLYSARNAKIGKKVNEEELPFDNKSTKT